MPAPVLFLTRNEGFAWHCSGDTCARGYAYADDGAWLEGPALARWAAGKRLTQAAEKLNGCWALVSASGEVSVVTDKTASFTLFHASIGGRQVISDDIFVFSDKYGFRDIDTVSALCHSMCGFVPDGDTLLKGVGVLSPGEFLTKGEDRPRRWHDFAFQTGPAYDEAYEYERALKMTDDVFGRLSASLKGRDVIVPLSGGYDSRLIAAMLKKGGVQNVTCFSYGKEDGYECAAASAVARDLGYKWVHVPASKERYRALSDERTLRFILYSGNGCSSPVMQDWYHMRYAAEQGLLPADALMIPGHSGDVTAGSYLPPRIAGRNLYSARDAVSFIYQKFFAYRYIFSPAKEKAVRKRIGRSLPVERMLDFNEFCAVADVWNIRNRQAKMIINGMRCQESLGFQWRLPLWDDAFSTFWFSLHPDGRKKRRLYDKLARERLFMPMGIDLPRAFPGAYMKKHGEYKKLLPLKTRRLYKIIKGRMRGYPDVNDLRSMIKILAEKSGARADCRRDHFGRIMASTLRLQEERLKNGRDTW